MSIPVALDWPKSLLGFFCNVGKVKKFFGQPNTFMLTFGIVSLQNFSHSIRCVVLSICGLNMHFSDD